MREPVILKTFSFLHEAHMVKLALESRGIDVVLEDTLSAQVLSLYSNAIGGVKLIVASEQASFAYRVLVEGGYEDEVFVQELTVSEKITQRIMNRTFLTVVKLVLLISVALLIAMMIF